jgi:hypothetical protein
LKDGKDARMVPFIGVLRTLLDRREVCRPIGLSMRKYLRVGFKNEADSPYRVGAA